MSEKTNDRDVVTKQPKGSEHNYNQNFGLESLKGCETVILCQVISACQVACCCVSGSGGYQIFKQGKEQPLFEIFEVSHCMFRQCIGAGRRFTGKLVDAEGNDVSTFERSCTCSRGCCCCTCILPQMDIYYPIPFPLGSIKERPTFDITGNEGALFSFSNDCCYSQYCSWFMDINITVKNKEGEPVAEIVKKSLMNAEELIGLENKVQIKFLIELKEFEKLLIIGSALLLSLNNFEDDKRLCC